MLDERSRQEKWKGAPESELIKEIVRLSRRVEAFERKTGATDDISVDAVDPIDLIRLKDAEAALRESENLFQSIIDNSPACISLKDLEQRYILVNKAFADMYGAPVQTFAGTIAGPKLTPSDREAMLALEKQVINTGKSITRERTQILVSGKQLFQLTTKFPVRDTKGDVTAIATITSDIADIRNAKQELEDVQARLSDILKIAPEAIVSMDATGQIMVFNDAAERIFGYRADEIIGRNLDILLPERFRANHMEYLEGFIDSEVESRPMSQRGEISGLRKDGMEFPIEASISQLRSRGQIVLTVTLHDITESKNAELLLHKALGDAQRADQSKQNFLANMSHELRTPLNAIMGFSEIMENQLFGEIGNERYRGYIGDIASSARHLLDMVNDVLDISKLEAGLQELHVTEFDIVEAIEDATRVVRGLMEAKDQRFVMEIEGKLSEMQADKTAFRQILVNLLSNAVKFTPEGGEIGLEVSFVQQDDPSQDLVSLTISDSGSGIPQEDIERILTPFVQVRQIDHTGKG
ncbi:MAG: PAS domain S-box protein, partial [Rhodospirillaceae bacterium]|nr:PAS domain S-box protein [Rhodospirillaceae bacterium]